MTPPHAYIPGRTARHPEDLFDPLKVTARRGMTSGELAESRAWAEGLRFYREGYYWEAHELLEAVWMATGPNSAERRMVQAVIQLANARLKAAMGRRNAAERLAGIAAAHLAEARAARGAVLGLSPDWVAGEIADVRRGAAEMQYNANLSVGGV